MAKAVPQLSPKSRGFSRRGMFLKPPREHATHNAQTYFVTSETWERRALFVAESWARLFFQTLLTYRGKDYLLHEFVRMPDHFHLLTTPFTALEHTVQLIKGGFSFRVKKEMGSNAEIWQRGFSDHRIRDFEDYDRHRHYIHLNPVKRHLCERPFEYKYSSAYPGWKLDPIPQGLKPPEIMGIAGGTAKAVPFQNNAAPRLTKAVSFQNTLQPAPFSGDSVLKGHDFSRAINGSQQSPALAAEGRFVENADSPQGLKPPEILGIADGTAKAVPFQNTSPSFQNSFSPATETPDIHPKAECRGEKK